MNIMRAAKLLETCEHGLRELVAESGKAGDYAAVRRLTDWAEAIKTLAAEAGASARATPTAPALAAPVATTPPRRTKVNEYPRFYRSGDDLVKVGWSKKAKSEYHHYAPRRAVDVLAAAVKLVGVGGRVFTSHDLLPLKDGSVGSDFPDYQVYLALAWLRHLNLVESHGRRGGYTLHVEADINAAVAGAWAELEQWRGGQ